MKGVGRRSVAFAIFLAAAAAFQFDALRGLFEHSREDASASHVVLIPVISAALIYERRKLVFSSLKWGRAAGLALVALSLFAGFAVRTFGPANQFLSYSIASLVVMWIGGFVLFYGADAFRRARFALFFLAFTIPFPPFLLDAVTEVLKVLSTEAVAALMTLIGLPYHREGFVFNLPLISIEVADACSGIRSSIALVLTALLVGNRLLQTAWTKTALVLAVFPITILKNGIRIVTLSWLATNVHPSFLNSRLHTDGGIVFFILALGLLMPIFALLRRVDRARVPAQALTFSSVAPAAHEPLVHVHSTKDIS